MCRDDCWVVSRPDLEVRLTGQIVQLSTRQMSAPHVVIIGGGFAGLSAAKALRRRPVRVTLVDRRNHHLFQPLLYQVATATLSPGDIASAIRWILRRADNVRVILGNVDAIDPVARRVHLDDGATLDYDYVDRRDRRAPRLLQSSRVGAVRPWPQDPGGRAGDSPQNPDRLRARGARRATRPGSRNC